MKKKEKQVIQPIMVTDTEIEVKVPRRTPRQSKLLGHSIERVYMNLFIEMGFAHCKTTRNTSRLLDACKVDLNFLPVLIQLKAGAQKGMSPTGILKSMEEELGKNYPDYAPEHSMPKLLIHHKDKPVGQQKRTKWDSMVTMSFEDFQPLLLAYHKQLQNDNKNTKRGD